ncbi:UDP-N-acetylmuramoylalanine--D-glutamate ligase [Pullulanibacillus pueri]|uniref:UDP-N-acetylmuramoylalanine--D-glutamate ligase n=1 Tax=Pullulanibacillus pueri TaxID=1437324 RepID=A0A8J2ZT05_9BACL|nr:UDP-N-acetylmuramoyl-L-alanine--D-glutamate ligase [Pullulanibacillus pueri]MBM7680133.1 UDP-N-acetylmuramoylalanine--D-glutamate ligase [Pullulanibacillus pueri]GGH74510.1 UDP-N-acetylmuramoylalanine--D-glutamate ligase [Pullulanibacillus pueri]
MRQIHEYTNKEILVLGMAKSGCAAAKLLNKLGAKVTVNDRASLKGQPVVTELENLGIRVVDNGHPLSLVTEETYIIVKNPGIPYTNPLIEKAESLSIPVITEVELAAQVSEAEFVGITGSNGKTTTTTLVGEMLKGSLFNPLVAGNIGTVLCEVGQKATTEDIIVAELSSFQLLGVRTFHPKIAVFLNLFAAHLDYHGSIEAYGQAKANITKNQTEEDWLVVNADDERVQDFTKHSLAQRVYFSTTRRVEGAYLEAGTLYFNGEAIIHQDQFAMPKGEHNIANALAAIAVAKIMDVPNDHIVHVLQTFTGVPHRLQYVETIRGRAFYNDSKATNILATSKALSAFQQPTILLAGGLDRGNGFEDLVPFLKNVKAIVTFGETKEKIHHTAKDAGVKITKMVDNIEEAVKVAYDLSEAGDVILLSPSCASWDQFKTFEERGDMFVNLVHTLK